MNRDGEVGENGDGAQYVLDRGGGSWYHKFGDVMEKRRWSGS